MKQTFAFGAATEQGTWPVQEDGFFADPVNGVFALADGFGGRGAGDLAAKAALVAVRARKTPAGVHGAGWSRDTFAEAQRAISARNQSKNGSARGGASLLLARVEAGIVDISHCGACTALLFREGVLRPLLLPQSAPREEFQPLLPDQALGLSDAPVPETRVFHGKSGDLLLLLSSGVEWESENFRAEVAAQLATREPGADLSSLAARLLGSAGIASQGWNRTIVLTELF